MKFAICNEIYHQAGWDLKRAMKHAARVGYEAIEIAPFTIAKRVTEVPAEKRCEIRRLAEEAGLKISGIHWVLVQTEGMHLTHPDFAIRARTARYFVELVDFCRDLGGRFIILGSPKQRSLEPGVSREQGAAWARETLQQAVRRAERCGVTICIEPLSPVETNFINTAAEAIEFVKSLPSPSLRIMLDVKAMSSEGKPIPQIIREAWPYFAYFHANDANLKGPGFGETDFRPIAAALREVGYEGYVSVEVFKFEEGPEAIASRSLAYLREVFDR